LKLRLVVVCALFLTGCAYFTAQPKLDECELLLDIAYENSQASIRVAKLAIAENDSLRQRTLILEEELRQCQQ